MRNLRYVLLVVGIIITIPLLAQKDKQSEAALKDRLWYGLNIGGIGINSYSFNIGLAPMGGIKLTDEIALGLIAKLNYQYYWVQGASNNHLFDYGGGALARSRLFKSRYFVQVEYDQMSLWRWDFQQQDYAKAWFPFLYIGGGMSTPSSGDWSSELSILYNVLPDSNREFFPLNLSYAFVYNF